MRLIRTFLSSTFKEFLEERRLIHKSLTKLIKERIKSKDFDIEITDMMYGVNSKIIKENLVTDLCLDEINRCHKTFEKPYFIALVGDSYGTVLAPTEIPGRVFKDTLRAVRKDEMMYLKKSYSEDCYAKKTIFLLSKNHKNNDKIVNILSNIASKSELGEVSDYYSKILTSVTEKEIRKAYSLNKNGCMFFIKKNNSSTYFDEKQEELKKFIYRHFSDNIFNYSNIEEFQSIFTFEVARYVLGSNLNSSILSELLAIQKAKDTDSKTLYKSKKSFPTYNGKNFFDNNNNTKILLLKSDSCPYSDSFYFNIIKTTHSLKPYCSNYFCLASNPELRNINGLLKSILEKLLITSKDREKSETYIEKISTLKEGQLARFIISFINNELATNSLFFINYLDFLSSSDQKKFLSLLVNHINQKNATFIIKTSKLDGFTQTDCFFDGPEKHDEIDSFKLIIDSLNNIGKKIPEHLVKQYFHKTEEKKYFEIHRVFSLLRNLTSLEKSTIYPDDPIAAYFSNLESKHGIKIVKQLFKFIIRSKYGLRASELADLFDMLPEVKEEFYTQYSLSIKLEKIPQVVVKRLLYDTSEYIKNEIDYDSSVYIINSDTSAALNKNLEAEYYVADSCLIKKFMSNKYSKRSLIMIPRLFIITAKANHEYIINIKYISKSISLLGIDFLSKTLLEMYNFFGDHRYNAINNFILRNHNIIQKNDTDIALILNDKKFNYGIEKLFGNNSKNPQPILSSSNKVVTSFDISKLHIHQYLSLTYSVELSENTVKSDFSIDDYSTSADIKSFLAFGPYLVLVYSEKVVFFDKHSYSLVDAFKVSSFSSDNPIVFFDGCSNSYVFCFRPYQSWKFYEYNISDKVVKYYEAKSNSNLIDIILSRNGDIRIKSNYISISKCQRKHVVSNKDYFDTYQDGKYLGRNSTNNSSKVSGFSPSGERIVAFGKNELTYYCLNGDLSKVASLLLDDSNWVTDIAFINENRLIVSCQSSNFLLVEIKYNQLEILADVKFGSDYPHLSVIDSSNFAIYDRDTHRVSIHDVNDFFFSMTEHLYLSGPLHTVIRVNKYQIVVSAENCKKTYIINLYSGFFKEIFNDIGYDWLRDLKINIDSNKLEWETVHKWEYGHIRTNGYGGKIVSLEYNNDHTFHFDKNYYSEFRYNNNETHQKNNIEEHKTHLENNNTDLIIYAVNNIIYIDKKNNRRAIYINDMEIIKLIKFDDHIIIGGLGNSVEIWRFSWLI